MFKTNLLQHKSKFKKDLNYNIISFVIIAFCGLLINTLITKFYGFSTLGFFNIQLVIYLVFSQISAWGTHLSVQKFTPQFSENHLISKEILTSAIILSSLYSMITAFVLFFANELPGVIIGNEILKQSFIYSIPGIIFITLNKTYLSFLNGMRFMKDYAFYNSLRTILMFLYLIFFIWNNLDVKYLALIFTIPEFILFVLLTIKLRNWITYSSHKNLKKHLKLHALFGKNAVTGNIMLTLNSKVDILTLSLIVPPNLVGVYSFAVFVTDGFTQLTTVFRNNINPIITQTYYNNKIKVLSRLINNWKHRFYKFFILIGVLIGICYPVLLQFLNIDSLYKENLFIFYGLLVGNLFISGYLPFQFIFNQIGDAKKQSKFLTSLFLINVSFNLVFVYYIGVYGSVISLIIVNVFQLFYIKNGINQIISSKKHE